MIPEIKTEICTLSGASSNDDVNTTMPVGPVCLTFKLVAQESSN